MENGGDKVIDIPKESMNPVESVYDLSSQDLQHLPEELLIQEVKIGLKELCLDYNEFYELPKETNQFSNLERFSLCGNNLSTLPELNQLVLLKELNLDENCLICLPESFGGLIALEKLSMIGNKVKTLPESFGDLLSLRELYIDENELEMINFSFQKLSNLEIFEATNNKLEVLSEDMGCAKKLRILNLNFNQLVTIPESISNLEVVEIFDLSNNLLKELPETFASSKTLIKCMAENNNLKYFPSWFGDLPNIQEMYLADNGVTNEPFDDEFCKNAQNLRILEAGANYMGSISEKFGSLSKLEQVHFGSTINELERSNFQNGNWIPNLPDSFCELKSLVKANINENQLRRLPERFGDLESLTWLDLGQNMLRHLPSTFCELRNLEFLQLSKNQLEALPDEIGNFQKLIELRLDNNLLKSVPESLGTIIGLKALDLFSNELEALPEVIFHLKKLTRLDLDHNNFEMLLDDVPKITPGVKYPERDPNLKDNWRGRTRQNKFDTNEVIIYNDDNMASEDTVEEEEWNYQALRTAMHRGMSFWRSHTNPNERRPVESKEETTVITNKDEPRFKDDNNKEKYVTNTTYKNKQNGTVSSVASDPNEEDWDEEIKVNTQYKSIILTCDERKTLDTSKKTVVNDFQKVVNRYPPAKQCFSSTAFYDSFIYAKKNNGTNIFVGEQTNGLNDSRSFVEGQFDDADY